MRLPTLAFAMFMGLSVGALAANLTIAQKGRTFSSENVTIKKGGTLTFLNDDSVPHKSSANASTARMWQPHSTGQKSSVAAGRTPN